MNERTKKLAGQALDKAVSYTWTTLNYEQIHELLACHAELIVRECAKVADEHDCNLSGNGGEILDHFGVE